ncbi:MAG: lipoprotein [Rhodocyclaceae bacterium]|nr:lipoprotein [Rhodocyclaceae bacterium]
MRPLLLAFCCVSCLAVSGCGIKGSLYLPKEPAQTAKEPALSVKEPAQSAEEAAQTDEEPALSAPEQTDAPEQTTAP